MNNVAKKVCLHARRGFQNMPINLNKSPFFSSQQILEKSADEIFNGEFDTLQTKLFFPFVLAKRYFFANSERNDPNGKSFSLWVPFVMSDLFFSGSHPKSEK